MERLTIAKLIFIAGFGQLAVVIGSTLIPTMLGWRAETAKLRPLTRQVFWTYAGYIFSTNLFFSIISIIGNRWLTDHSPLAAAVTIFIACYWGARVLIQFFYFDRADAPQGMIYKLGEFMLVSLFCLFTIIYSYAALFNIQEK